MSGNEAKECVKVVLRCRPMSNKEKADRRERAVSMDTETGMVSLRRNSAAHEPPKDFTFDACFDWSCEQQDVYDTTARPIVDSVINGFNGTVFAYGQTGTGKTWTMEGCRDERALKGVIPRTFDHIFESIATISEKNFLVRASYLEIYNENIRDLLKRDDTKLQLKETAEAGIGVQDLSSYVVKSVEELEQVFSAGTRNRTTGATLMNPGSSRSHSIFTITIEQSSCGGGGGLAVGKLNLVDLAGSERQAKTGATGARLKEATKINLSLTALGMVIKALVDPKTAKGQHIPYRDSKLTRLLQDSLGGNAKTVMIANLGPADYNYDETLSTLRYANRAKMIKNKPRVNEDPKDTMLREFQAEIARLQAQIKEGTQAGGTEVRKQIDEEEKVWKRKLEDLREAAKVDLKKVDEENLKLTQEREEAHLLKLQELAEQKAIATKLELLQGKMLQGGVSLLDQVAKDEAQQQRLRQQMKQQQEEEEMMKQRLAEQAEVNLEKQAHYGSLQEEVADLERKLTVGRQQLRKQQTEHADTRAEFEREKDEICETIHNMSYESKLQRLVLHRCIPEHVIHKIMKIAQYNAVRGEWLIHQLNKAGSIVRAQHPDKYTSSTVDGWTQAAAGIWSRGGGGGGAKRQVYLSYDEMLQEQRRHSYHEQSGLPGSTGAKARARAAKAKLKTALAATAALDRQAAQDKGGEGKRPHKMEHRHDRQREGDPIYPESRGNVEDRMHFA